MIYQPTAGYRGTDSFTYFVTDDLGVQSNTATVTVTVTNNPPAAVADAAPDVVGGHSVTINVVANDTDIDNDSLIVSINVLPGPPNKPPTAFIAGGNRAIPDSNIQPGESVRFDSSQSLDTDGRIVSCQWTVNSILQSGGCSSNLAFPLIDRSTD